MATERSMAKPEVKKLKSEKKEASKRERSAKLAGRERQDNRKRFCPNGHEQRRVLWVPQPRGRKVFKWQCTKPLETGQWFAASVECEYGV